MNPITDHDGIYRIVGLGSVASMMRQLAYAAGLSQVNEQDLIIFKAALIGGLGRFYSAVSTDLVYGYPACKDTRSNIQGLVLSVQERPLEYTPLGERAWRTEILHEWSSSDENIWNADAFKVTVYYRKDLETAVREHQQSVVMRCADRCGRLGVPFILEIMSQPLTEQERSNPRAYARCLPDIVAGYVDEFSERRYGVDVLKVDFPADLRYCEGMDLPGGTAEEPIYSLNEVKGFCQALTRRSPVPWIIMSGGVGLEEFLAKVRIAVSSGASGFIGGRSLWAGAVSRYPDYQAVNAWMRAGAREIHRRVLEASLRW